ncbi:MAG: hypothetical protein GY749_38255 [Desulfobacteraceae bacterium]|nr:hypothetical protein [Desulfobacteraceae bacterium]
MKDDNGLYYNPFPENSRVRMYVREAGSDICFRLWNSDDPALWEEHGWVPYDAVKAASAMYDKHSKFNPNNAYDIEVARALIMENK